MTSIAQKIKRAYSDHSWLPFRTELQKAVRAFRARRNEFEVHFKGIRSTKPLTCNPAAQTQMHVLTCHKHLSMFLLSAKSLLRFKPNIAVVLHDDGSLTGADIRTHQHHIVGIQIIRRAEADAVFSNAALDCPRLLAYRAKVINSLELTDHIMLGSARN